MSHASTIGRGARDGALDQGRRLVEFPLARRQPGLAEQRVGEIRLFRERLLEQLAALPCRAATRAVARPRSVRICASSLAVRLGRRP